MHVLELELPDMLYDFWDKLPIIKDVGPKIISKLASKKTQSYIIHSLSIGTEDIYPSGPRKRYALTANEIQEIILSKYDLDVNKSNLYYHLQKLVDIGIIQVVTTVQRANIVTSYYGRTSKLIFSDDNDPDDESNLKQKMKKNHSNPIIKLLDSAQFIDLLRSYDPTESLVKEVVDLSEKVKDHGFEHNREFKDWMINNEEKFRGVDIELMDFNYLFNKTKSFNEDMNALLLKINEILKF